MDDRDKSKEQLISELDEMRNQLLANERLLFDSGITDTTGRGLTYDSRRSPSGYLDAVLLNLPVGVAILEGSEFRYFRINKRLAEINGLSVEEHLGRPLAEVLPDAAKHILPRISEVMATGRPAEDREFCTRLPKDPDEERWFIDSFFPIFGLERDVVAVGVVVIDITQRKQTEEEMRRSHSLESLGVLAGGIAHDFNNVLTGILGNLSLLERLLDKNSKGYKWATKANKFTLMARDLTSQLMTFAKGGAPVTKTASVEELIREITDLTLHGSNIKPEYHFEDGLQSVNIDVGQIGQVMQNLLMNADQAMPNGGTLKISANNVEISRNNPLPLEPGLHVQITVADQGSGMSEEVLRQVFNPYFSTKDSGHGLGLAIAYRIIERHGGHITVKSELGVGTTFVFYLRASWKQANIDADQKKELAFGKGRILLMDDEEMIRTTVSEMLNELGYEVESVYDGLQVLKAYETSQEADTPYDLVIMDLTVPGGMGGREAVERLREMHPEARVMGMT